MTKRSLIDIWLCSDDGAWLELQEPSMTAAGTIWYTCPKCRKHYQLIQNTEAAMGGDSLVEIGQATSNDATSGF